MNSRRWSNRVADCKRAQLLRDELLIILMNIELFGKRQNSTVQGVLKKRSELINFIEWLHHGRRQGAVNEFK